MFVGSAVTRCGLPVQPRCSQTFAIPSVHARSGHDPRPPKQGVNSVRRRAPRVSRTRHDRHVRRAMLLEDAHVGVHDRRIRSSELSVARLGHGVGFANSSRLFIDVDAARFGALCCRRGGRAAWSGRAYLAVRNLFALVWLLAREGCANSVSCGDVVFVDEAAQSIAALDRGGR